MSTTAPLPASYAASGALRVAAWMPPDAGGWLAAIAPARAAAKLPLAQALPLPWLGGSSRVEFWHGGHPAAPSMLDDVQLTQAGDVLFGTLALDEAAAGGIEAAAEAGYRRLLALSAQHGCPHVLRVWNFLGAINDGDGDAERYRRFCVGRARAIPQEPATGYAAATAVGIPGPPTALHLHWLAARRPGVGIENPRQVSAWEYPREYGPVAPGFSRAMLLEWADPALLLISGTASILGHATAHHDVLAQLDETLRNLDALVARAAARVGSRARFGEGSLLRVYLRDPAHAAAVAARLTAQFGPDLPVMLLHGDLCRSELAIEVEAVQALAG